MNRGGKSDRLIVAEKRSNKEDGAPSSAEGVEPSGLTKGNTLQQTKSRTPSREGRDMANSKRARSEKSRIQPRASAYVELVLAKCAGRIRQSVCLVQHLRVTTRGRSPVREFRSLGSVRGAARKGRPYREAASAV